MLLRAGSIGWLEEAAAERPRAAWRRGRLPATLVGQDGDVLLTPRVPDAGVPTGALCASTEVDR